MLFFFFKQKTAYEMRISDWSSDVCSSDLAAERDDLAQHLDEEARQGQVRPFRSGGGVHQDQPASSPLLGGDQRRAVGESGPGLVGRSEGRRVGKEGVSTCRSRVSPDH